MAPGMTSPQPFSLCSCLELKLQRELDNARIPHGVVIHAKRRRSNRGVVNREVWVIEDVKEIRSELQTNSLRDWELLHHENIPVLLKWTAGLSQIPTGHCQTVRRSP
jgi:hypothetical protein